MIVHQLSYDHYRPKKGFTYSSRLIGSVVSDDFLLVLRCERPLRSLRKDSRRDFFKDLRLDMGLSSALAISKMERKGNDAD